MSYPESLDHPSLSHSDCDALRDVALKSIHYGLYQRQPLEVDASSYTDALNRRGAAFVTLKIAGRLRGCMGSLEAHEPLVVSVAQNAFNAAFQDPRFSPVSEQEASRLEVSISVLGQPQEMFFESEADLLSQLRPSVDGLILEEGARRGTFLPAVWEALPDPKQFLRQLKRKAGLPEDYWSDTVRIQRYQVQAIG